MEGDFSTLDLQMRWQDQKVEKRNGKWFLKSRAGAEPQVAYFKEPPNMPGKTVVGIIAKYPPGGDTPPHYHGGGAVFATMIKGKSVMQMVCPEHEPQSQGTGAKVYGFGESWYEPPGCHHVRSHNASDDEECQFVVMFVMDTERVREFGALNAVTQIGAAELEAGRVPGGSFAR